MRKALLVGLGLLLCVSMASTQTKFPPSGGGTGSFVSPGAGIIVDTDGAGTLSGRTIAAGDGIVVSNGAGAAGDPTISIDGSTVVAKGSGTALPAACGDTGDDYLLTDRYLHTGERVEYTCIAIDTWAIASEPQFIASSVLFDDFLLGLATTGNTGFGWNHYVIGSGSSNALTWGAGGENNPGVLVLDTGTTDNTGYGLMLGGNGLSLNTTNLWRNRRWLLETVVYVGATSDATETSFWFGLTTNSGATISRGVFLRYDTDLSDTQFVAAVCDSSTTGCQEAGDATNQESALSGVSVADDTWFRLRIRHDPTGGPSSSRLIGMQVNDATEVTFCSSGCTDTVAQFANDTHIANLGLVARGTTEKHWWIDFIHVKFEGLDRY